MLSLTFSLVAGNNKLSIEGRLGTPAFAVCYPLLSTSPV